MIAALSSGTMPQLDEPFVEAMRAVLRHPTLDAAFKELALTLPSELYIAEQVAEADPQRIHTVRERCWRSSRRACTPTGSGPGTRTR